MIVCPQCGYTPGHADMKKYRPASHEKLCLYCRTTKPLCKFPRHGRDGRMCLKCKSDRIIDKHRRRKTFEYRNDEFQRFLCSPWRVSKGGDQT